MDKKSKALLKKARKAKKELAEKEEIAEAIEGQLIPAPGSKYHVGLIPKMVEAMESGATDIQLCQLLGIARDTFYRWLRDNPEFKEAHDKGLIACQAWWENLGKMGMMNPKALDSKLYLHFMKVKFKEFNCDPAGGNSPQSINIGTLSVTNIKSLSQEELQAQIQASLERLGSSDPEAIQKLMLKTVDNQNDL